MKKLLFFLLFINGCGFQPLYHNTEGEVVKNKLFNTKIYRIAGIDGQILYNALLNKMNPRNQTQNSKYALLTKLSLSKAGTSFRRDNTAKSYKYQASVSFTLINNSTKKIVYEDSVIRDALFNIYNNSTNFSQYSSEFDAKNKALELAAEEIHLLIASYYRKWDND